MSPLNLAAHLGQDTFLAQVLHRQHLHVTGAIKDPASLISWDDLNNIIAAQRLEPPRLRLSVEGEMLPQYRYASPVSTRRHTVYNRLMPSELHARLREGASLVIDAIDEIHPAVGAAAAELEGWLRTGVQTNLYASWTAKEGFGTHWDDHDVVVVQIDGAKRWRLFGQTRIAPMYKDTEEPEEPPQEPIAELVLRPGDILYLPRGTWHAVSASEGERSLHLTFGIQTMSGAQLLAWLADDLRSEELLRLDLPVHAPPGDRRTYLEKVQALVSAALDDPSVITRYVASRNETDLQRLRPSLPYIDGLPADGLLSVRLTTGRASMSRQNGSVIFRATDNEWELAEEAAPLLSYLIETFPHPVALYELAGTSHLSVPTVAAFLSELVDGQALTVVGRDR
ncbi:cupin domain-containing protein [Streptomyces sp. NPDC005918]|uniref:cupin domain-containing protein n=1 Tax=Streptomyces sp. NPDC005918 TaxID=3155454 RepID=UPI0033EFF8F4